MPNIPITSVADLYSIGTDPAFPNNGIYDLAGSLNLGGTPRSPLPTFYGAFYGHGNKITGLNVTSSSPVRCGLFTSIQTANISPPNPGVYDLEIHGVASASDVSAGLLVGRVDGSEVYPNYFQNIKCFGEVTGTTGSGGIFGVIKGGSAVPAVTGCCFEGIVNGNLQCGGIAGELTRSMTDCYADAVVTGVAQVGGLVGAIESAGNVNRCFSRGTATATLGTVASVGGLIGRSTGGCANSYSVADAIASNSGSYVGGLIGRKELSDRVIAYNFAAGQVSGGGTHTGGFIGGDISGSIYTANFWDMEATGRANAGTGVTATGLTTAEAEKFSTYFDAGWDIVAIPVSSP